MLEGTAEFAELVNGKLQWKPVQAPGMMNIPSNSVHGFRNTSQQNSQVPHYRSSEDRALLP